MKKWLDATKPSCWLEAVNVPDEMKEEIRKMSPEEKEQAFGKGELAFGTAGIRGKMGSGTKRLNKFVYQQMTVGVAKWIKLRDKENPSIIIGHDNRMHSAEYAIECAKVAQSLGIKVYLFEKNRLMPTPIISYAIRRFKATGGINITASHNPKEDNGFKVYNSLGAQILPADAKIIVNNMPKSAQILNIKGTLSMLAIPTKEVQFINYDKITNEYFDDLILRTNLNKEFLDKNYLIKKQKIVFTGFQGTTTELMPKFLKKLGFKHVYVVPCQSKISDKFEGCTATNPENSKSFEQAIKFANKKRAVIIFGADPDGDRMSIGFRKTNHWRFLNGNEMGIIFTYYILKNMVYDKPPLVLSTHVSTNYIDRIAAKFNAEVVRTRTGFKWMGNAMDKYLKTKTFVCAFEEAIGALVHSACRDKDSFGAAMLALEIYATECTHYVDLHDYLQQHIMSIFGATYSATVPFTIQSSNWAVDAKKMMKRALMFKPGKIFDYNVEKVYFSRTADAVVWELDKDSWIKFRISGTEPKFKAYLCLNNQMLGQLKTAGNANISLIEEKILQGFKYNKEWNYGK